MYDIAYRAPIANSSSYGDTSRGPSKGVLHLSLCIYYNCFDKFSKGKPCLIYREKFTSWLIKKRGKTNHNHKTKYDKCKILYR